MKRRRVLQHSAGIGLLGVSNVQKTDFSTQNSARLVEIGFDHDVDLPSEQLRKASIQFAAEPPEYQLAGDDLLVTGFASDSVKKSLTTGENLVDFDSVHAAPTGELEADGGFNLVTRRNDGLQPVSGVSTAESYAPPSVETEFSPGKVTVTTAGESVTVANESARTLELPSTEVEVKWREKTGERVSKARSPEGKETVSKYEAVTATATVTPVLKVRNDGVLNVKTGGAE